MRHRIAFLPDYDIGMARDLMPGVDVWLNNPLRPLEACGTSGMKVALNGGLNLSILDGWWDEMFDGDNGWAIPSADGVIDQDRRDELEADALYDLIENNVRARFYERGRGGSAAALGRDGAPRPDEPRPAGAGDADGARLRQPALHAGRGLLAGDAGRHLRGCQGPRGLAGHARRQVVLAYGSVTSRRSARATTPRSATCSAYGPASTSAVSTSATSTVQVVYGRADDYDELHDIAASTLSPDGVGEDGLHRFEGSVPARPYRILRLQRPGPAVAPVAGQPG